MKRIQLRPFIKNNRSLFIFILLFAFARTTIADWSPVPSGSMEPTILPGDVLLIDKTSFGPTVPLLNKRIIRWGKPVRGDIITFVPPHTSDLYVKRVIAVPGDQIIIEGTNVFINGTRLTQTLQTHNDRALIIQEVLGNSRHLVKLSKSKPMPNKQRALLIPPGKYFVMGDHRNNSIDSRYWGFVDEENIMGKVSRLAVSFSSERRLFSSLGMSLL